MSRLPEIEYQILKKNTADKHKVPVEDIWFIEYHYIQAEDIVIYNFKFKRNPNKIRENMNRLKFNRLMKIDKLLKCI